MIVEVPKNLCVGAMIGMAQVIADVRHGMPIDF